MSSSCTGSWMTGDAPLCAPEGDVEDNDEQIIQIVSQRMADKYARRQSAVEQRMAELERIMSSSQMASTTDSATSGSRTIKSSSHRAQSHAPSRVPSRPPPRVPSGAPSRAPPRSQSHAPRRAPPPPPVDKAVVINDDYDSDTSDVDTHEWDVVQIKPIQDMSTISSGKGGCCSKKGRWICIALLAAALIAVAVTVPLLLTRDKRSTDTSAATTNTGDGGISWSPTGPLSTEPPTAAPVVQLPPECLTLSDGVDVCLTEKMTQDESQFCIDCMWRFLPDNTGYCEPLETAICNIVQSCGCSICKEELVSYLDCQTECELDCSE